MNYDKMWGSESTLDMEAWGGDVAELDKAQLDLKNEDHLLAH